MDFTDEFISFIGNPSDLTLHTLVIPGGKLPCGHVIYLSSITDGAGIKKLILDPLMDIFSDPNLGSNDIKQDRRIQSLYLLGSKVKKDFKTLSLHLYKASCIVVFDSIKECLVVDVSQWNDRSVTAPDTENSLIGPKDSFIEDIQTNLSMIRRRVRHENLTIRELVIGSKSQTKVMIIYMKDLAEPDIINNLVASLDSIKMDVVLDATQLAHLILDKPKWFTPFPLFQTTERPDKSVSGFMEGRILLLADASPTGVLFPVTLSALYQTVDDYLFPSLSGTFLRFIRLIGLFLTLFLPALYVSITSVNQDVLRVQFMLAVAASREGVPYSAYIEVIFMMILMELINEATVRLPKVIGGTATIVGGLIIGTAAAQSHLISNIMIVITAATAIGSYTNPNYMLGMAWRICSYFLVALAIPWGLYGMTIGTAFILLYLSHLKSLGVSYLAPYSTFQYRDLFRDALIRIPKGMMKSRPAEYSSKAKGSRRLSYEERDDLL